MARIKVYQFKAYAVEAAVLADLLFLKIDDGL